MLPSGNNFIWKAFPNIVDSKLPKAVKINKNSTDPIYPPRIVWSCDDVNQVLYICIPENIITVNIDENRNDTPLVIAKSKRKMMNIHNDNNLSIE